MRKLLLASVAAIAISGSAHAQIFGVGTPVFDAANTANTALTAGRVLESIGIEGQQLDQLVQTYTEVVNVYNMATNVWNSVSGIAGADGWAAGLNDPAMRNPLPYAAAQHPAYVGGLNDPSGLPFGAQYLSQNTVGGNAGVYNDGSFAGSEITKELYSLSSMQAVATNHLQSIESRITALGDLFSQLASIGTVQQTDSLQARFNAELNYANSQQTQATQAMAAAQMQIAARDSAQRQFSYQDEIAGIMAACTNVSAASSTVMIPACANVAGGGKQFFAGVAGTPGAGQSIGIPSNNSPSAFLVPGTDTAAIPVAVN